MIGQLLCGGFAPTDTHKLTCLTDYLVESVIMEFREADQVITHFSRRFMAHEISEAIS